MTLTEPQARPEPNWKQVVTFVGITFALTYMLDLLLYLAGGFAGNYGITLLLQVQMLIPACVAIILQVFVFKDSPIYRVKETTRWFFYGYLVYALIHLGIALSAFLIANETSQMVASGLVQLLLIVILLLVVLLRLLTGKEAFHRAGLAGGTFWTYLSFGLFLAAIYLLMTGLNALFDLGQRVDFHILLNEAGAAQMPDIPDWLLLTITGLQAVILGPVLALPVAFGEEYGWRGYLQGELIKVGRVRGILLVGLIWGLWHAPIIAMGYNYPGYPVLGIFLMTLYTIGLGFVLSYAVLKTGSVWLAAFLHGLNNQVAAFLMAIIYKPDNLVLSFGLGVYGMIVWAIVVAGLLLLDRKAWKPPEGAAGELHPAHGASEG